MMNDVVMTVQAKLLLTEMKESKTERLKILKFKASLAPKTERLKILKFKASSLGMVTCLS